MFAGRSRLQASSRQSQMCSKATALPQTLGDIPGSHLGLCGTKPDVHLLTPARQPGLRNCGEHGLHGPDKLDSSQAIGVRSCLRRVPVCSMMERSVPSPWAINVARPDRGEWPEKVRGLRPARPLPGSTGLSSSCKRVVAHRFSNTKTYMKGM